MAGVAETAEQRKVEADDIIHRRTNQEMGGFVVPATMKVDDTPVFVIKGTVVMHDDGSAVDHAASDDAVVIMDAATGEVKMVSPEAIMRVDAGVDPEQERARLYADIEADLQAKQAAIETATDISGSRTGEQEGDGPETYSSVENVQREAQPIIATYTDRKGSKSEVYVVADNTDKDGVRKVTFGRNVTKYDGMQKQSISAQLVITDDMIDWERTLNGVDAFGRPRSTEVDPEEQERFREAWSNVMTGAAQDFRAKELRYSPDGKVIVAENMEGVTIFLNQDPLHPQDGAERPIESNRGSSIVGRSLTEAEATDLISRMEANAETAPELELTIENWDKLFGETGQVATPIGEVTMGEHQFAKMMRQGRNGKLGLIKPTLVEPDVIIEQESEAKKGEITSRPSSFIFVKSFIKEDGSRYYHFTSITVSREGKEVVISNQEKSRNKILRLLQDGKIVWYTPKDVTTYSADRQGLDYEHPKDADDASKGSGITPQTMISNDKGSETRADMQAQMPEITEGSALSRIPVGDDGEPKFTSVDPETGWDGLVEAMEGEKNAYAIAQQQQNDWYTRVRNLEKNPPTKKTPKLAGKGSPMAMRAEQKRVEEANAKAQAEYQQKLAEAEHEYAAWKAMITIYTERNRAQRLAREEAERQAEEARRQEQQRINAERDERIEADGALQRREAQLEEYWRNQMEKARTQEDESTWREQKKHLDRKVRDAAEQMRDCPEALEILENMDPMNLHEVAAWTLSGQKILMGSDGVRRGAIQETGYGHGEMKGLFGLFARRSKGGKSLQEIAGDMMKENCEMFGVPYDNQDAMSALLDVLQSCRTYGDIKRYIADNRIEQARNLYNSFINQVIAANDEYYREHYHTSYAEYEAYEEQMMEQAALLTDDDWRALDEIMADAASLYEQDNNRLIRTENGRTDNDTNRPTSGRGAAVLPQERIDNPRGGQETQSDRPAATGKSILNLINPFPILNNPMFSPPCPIYEVAQILKLIPLKAFSLQILEKLIYKIPILPILKTNRTIPLPIQIKPALSTFPFIN